MNEIAIEELVVQARSGSGEAREEVVRRIQDKVYALSLRMLFHPADAEDAAQDILVKVITNLNGFRFEGPFPAWVLRIAANHLRGARKRRAERRGFDLEQDQARIERAQARGWFSQPLDAPRRLLEVEMRSACTQALLLALDRAHRLAFILGVVFEVSSQEGAYILDITPAAFRKRLSRGRGRIMDFLITNSDFFDETNPCRSVGVAYQHVAKGWLNPEKPIFAPPDSRTEPPAALRDYMKELDDLGKVSAMYHALPASRKRMDFAAHIKGVLGSGEYRIFDELKLN